MNAIRQTQQLNRRELENATPPSASWHADYRDTAWIYVGGFPLDLSEGDIVTIFSQFGNPTHLNLIRDRETGKSKGFGFLKYEDQRSCDLAVDNLGGAEVLGRMLRVDHTRYKKRDDEDEDTHRIDRLEAEIEAEKQGSKRASDAESDGERDRRRRKRKELKEGVKKLAITENGDEQDPIRDYIDWERRRDGVKDAERRHRHRERRERHESRDEEDRERRTYVKRDEERRHRYREHRNEPDLNNGEDRERTREQRQRRGKDDRDNRAVEDRSERRHRRRRSRQSDSESERDDDDKSTRRNGSRSRGKWKRGQSLSPSNQGVLRMDTSLGPLTAQGKSSKPGRLKFKGDD